MSTRQRNKSGSSRDGDGEKKPGFFARLFGRGRSKSTSGDRPRRRSFGGFGGSRRRSSSGMGGGARPKTQKSYPLRTVTGVGKGAVFAAAPVTVRGSPVHVGGDPTGRTFLYACANTIVIRDLVQPEVVKVYDQHGAKAACARYSPSREFIASADVNGKVRIWEANHPEMPLKYEWTALAGKVMDMTWDAEGTRLFVAGEGRGRFASAFKWDTGGSQGELSGHTKAANSIALQPSPGGPISKDNKVHLLTASLDQTIHDFMGPPFRYNAVFKDHTNFVNCVRFSPDGRHFASVGSDKKVLIYSMSGSSVTADLQGHTGGVYAVSWNRSGDRFITASADKTVRLWDMQSGKASSTFSFGDSLEHQQVGCLWQGDYMISISLAGDVSYLDPRKPGGPARVLRGHNKAISALAYSPSNHVLYSGGTDGVVQSWSPSDASSATGQFSNSAHSNQIKGLACSDYGGRLVSAALDDTLRSTELRAREFAKGAGVKTGAAPVDLAVGNARKDLTVLATVKSLDIYTGTERANSLPTSYTPTAIAMGPTDGQVAVGGDNNQFSLYQLTGEQLDMRFSFEGHRGAVTCVDIAPNGQYVAAGDANREVIVVDVNEKKPVSSGWVFHTARVAAVAFSPDSQYVASGSLDQNIIIWSLANPSSRQTIKRAHQGGVSKLLWIDNETLASAGQDGFVRTWKTTQ